MLRMAKNGKKLHESPFSTLETTNWGKKSNYQNLPHSIFEESYEDAICQISGNLTDIVDIYLHSSKFLKHFFVQINPKILDFASQILKIDNSR